jgi:hypothetical protein
LTLNNPRRVLKAGSLSITANSFVTVTVTGKGL